MQMSKFRIKIPFLLICFSILFCNSNFIYGKTPGEKLKEECFPVLNLENFLSNDPLSREQFVSQLGEALHDFGFFALINHGIEKKQLSEHLDQLF
jgi:hypothetical protein